MDTLTLQRPAFDKIATSVAGISIAFCLIIAQTLLISANDFDVGITGVSPRLDYIRDKQLKEEQFNNEIKSKYMIIEGIVSVVVNILLFAFKYAVGIFSGSLSIIADAWHSLSDSISSIIVIIGGIFSKKPADKEHPFGHGRIELITSFIVGIMLIFIGYTFFAEAIKNLLNKQTATFNKISIIAMIVSIIIKEILAQYSFGAYRKSGAKSLYADAWHHRSDSITSIIILVGILIGKNFWQLDGILSIIVSIVIFIAAFDVIKSSIKPLIGEYPSEEIINKIKEMEPNSEFLYIGTTNRMEKDLIPSLGYKYEALEVKGLKRKLTLDNIKTVTCFISAIKRAKEIIKDFDPDIVIGCGGIRNINAPLPNLKQIQYWILENILNTQKVSPYAKAFA